MRQITLVHIALCCVIFAICFTPAAFDTLPFLEELKLKSMDLRFHIRGGRKPSGNVVIAGIEAKSIHAYGRWPWPRSVFAQLLVRLKESGARTIVFDLIFSEPEDNKTASSIASLAKTFTQLNLLTTDFNSHIFFDEMNQAMAEADNDTLLGDAMGFCGNVILGMAVERGSLPEQAMDAPGMDANGKALYKFDPWNKTWQFPDPVRGDQVLLPIPALETTAAGMGYVNVFPDRDGIIRRAPAAIFAQKVLFMPLAVAAAGHYLGADPFWDPRGTLRIGDRKIAYDTAGNIHLDFYGIKNSFARFSIVDIIEGRVSPEKLKDKIIIIGSMATGIGDIWPTPLSGEIPGVFVQATLVDNIVQNRVLQLPEHQIRVLAAMVFALAFLPLGLMAFFSPLVFMLSGLFFLAAYTLGTQYLFTTHQLIWPMVLPLGAGFLSIMVLLVYNFMIEGRQHRWIKKSFAQYLSPDVIDFLVREPGQLKLGGEEKELTVLLADIRNFTTLSEGLSPTDLTQLLNLYLGNMTGVILDNGGTRDKYMGDAVMAFFGAPLHDPHNPETACRTAIMMCEHLHEKRKEWVQQGLPCLQVGMGINTGPMVVGNLGSDRRFDYSVIGDHVNLASRLEGLTKVYGVKILISENTRQHLNSGFTCRELDMVRVKGKKQPVRIHELLGKDYFTNGAYAFVDSFEKGLACYRNGSFPKAIQAFEQTLLLKPGDTPSQLFMARCRTLMKDPLPEDWDGTWTFTGK
ncbi:MAG: adenylate/guanylate cyclase domain-containing protein [Proteobacteria bacterium]|nr:adenylate/guanylate cyclase domain-containing protein [Pseudomonadota bacterium]